MNRREFLKLFGTAVAAAAVPAIGAIPGPVTRLPSPVPDSPRAELKRLTENEIVSARFEREVERYGLGRIHERLYVTAILTEETRQYIAEAIYNGEHFEFPGVRPDVGDRVKWHLVSHSMEDLTMTMLVNMEFVGLYRQGEF